MKLTRLYQSHIKILKCKKQSIGDGNTATHEGGDDDDDDDDALFCFE